MKSTELEELKGFKKKSGWSQYKLASHLGVHPQTVHLWFTGKYKPSQSAREKIRRFLDEYSY